MENLARSIIRASFSIDTQGKIPYTSTPKSEFLFFYFIFVGSKKDGDFLEAIPFNCLTRGGRIFQSLGTGVFPNSLGRAIVLIL